VGHAFPILAQRFARAPARRHKALGDRAGEGFQMTDRSSIAVVTSHVRTAALALLAALVVVLLWGGGDSRGTEPGRVVIDPALMSISGDVALFLEIPGIPGESATGGQEGDIDIESMTLAANRSPRSRLSFTPAQIAKGIDKASPKLLSALTAGTVLSTATVTARQTNENGEQEVAGTWLFENVTVVDLADVVSTSAGGQESLSLRYGKITFTYGEGPATVSTCWDVDAQAAC